MARSQLGILADPARQHSGVQPIDQANGMHFDLSPTAVQLIKQQWPLHLIVYNSGTTGNATLRAGYGPWATNAALGDLNVSVTTGTVVDLGPQVDFSRFSRDPFGSFDIDFAAGFAGSILAVFGNSAPVPAATAGNIPIKHIGGNLLAIALQTTGAGALTHYDHQGAAAGTQLHQIAGSAPLGIYTPSAVARNGITAANTATGPGVTVFFT